LKSVYIYLGFLGSGLRVKRLGYKVYLMLKSCSSILICSWPLLKALLCFSSSLSLTSKNFTYQRHAKAVWLDGQNKLLGF